SAMKKSRRFRSPFSSFLDCTIGLPTSCVSVRASVSWRALMQSRKARIASTRFLTDVAAHGPCAARARSYLRRTAKAPSSGTSVITAPVAGLRIFMRESAARVREEVVENRRVVDEGAIVAIVELRMPLDGEDVRGSRPADRLDEPIGLRPCFDDEIAAEVLHCLMMHRVGLGERDARIEPREARAGDERRSVVVFVVDVPVAMVERTGDLQ